MQYKNVNSCFIISRERINCLNSILTKHCECRSVTWLKKKRGFSEPIDGMGFLETVFQSKYQTKLYLSQNYGVIILGEGLCKRNLLRGLFVYICMCKMIKPCSFIKMFLIETPLNIKEDITKYQFRITQMSYFYFYQVLKYSPTFQSV